MQSSHWINLAIAVAAAAALVTAVVMWPRPTASGTAGGDWTCSMHPQVRMRAPGRCPICGMDLIPVAELAARQAKNQGQAKIDTEAVIPREVFKEIRTVGRLDYNESRVEYITARMDGRADKLYVDFTGVDVKRGDHLVDLYSPALVVVQEELLLALESLQRLGQNPDPVLADFPRRNIAATREKLRLLGILPEQIAEIERTRKVQTHVTIHAPLGGTVIEKGVRAGQYVKEGDMLYRIAELDPIWLYLEIFESDIAWVRYGQRVDVVVEAFPGVAFPGIVTFIDPFLNEASRTVKVRVNLKNPERRLKPGMYATAGVRIRLLADGSAAPTGLEGKYTCPMHPEVVRDQGGECPICKMVLVQIPSNPPFSYLTGGAFDAPSKATGGDPLVIRTTAVLDTGTRRIAYHLRSDGAFDLVELQTGPRAYALDEKGRKVSYYVVREGLKSGDRVAVQSGFLIDSQRQIEGMPSLLFPQGISAQNLHAGHGDAATPAPTPAPHKH